MKDHLVAPGLVLEACEAVEEARVASATFTIAYPPEDGPHALATVTVCLYRREEGMTWGVVWQSGEEQKEYDLIAPWEARQDAATAAMRLLSRLTSTAKNFGAAIYLKGFEVFDGVPVAQEEKA